MAIHKLEKLQWHAYFDVLSKTIIGKRAEIEVISIAIGDQIQAEWLPLIGIVYDPKDDIVEILVEGLDHIVTKPHELYVDYGAGGLVNMEIIDVSGVQQIIQFRDPLMLPKQTAVS